MKVAVWNENYHEQEEADVMGPLYPDGLHGEIKKILETEEDIEVRIATQDMENCGLSEEILDDTDVLIWWGHARQECVPDEIAAMVVRHVQNGMGFIALHSSHFSKPFRWLTGAPCSLQWREGDRERVWCVDPSHPIAKGVDPSFDLEVEEMYGEPFAIPSPDAVVFMGWFAGGEVFRSGCTFRRGLGKIFYFQPGHETNTAYKNENYKKILRNAVRWAAPQMRGDAIAAPHAKVSPEALRAEAQENK